MSLELYTYFRSSCSYRVRIAFGVKGLAYKPTFVHLVNNGGEQHKDSYKKLNPISEVPYLKLEDGRGFAQSVAIIEYLEEVQPQPALLPKDPYGRARVRQMAEIVNSSIQPLQNLSVTKELTARYGSSETQNQQWVQHWMSRGFSALESVMRETAGRYSYGDTITMADCFFGPPSGRR
jgi:maleylacetoacetate isomerase